MAAGRAAACSARRAGGRRVAPQADPPLALEHGAAVAGERDAAMALDVDLDQIQGGELAQHAAPARGVEVAADPEHRQAVVPEALARSFGSPRSTSIRWPAPKRWPVR